MSKRFRIYTAEDVAEHSSPSSCWVSRAGKVYDITSFLDGHPGGDDLLLKHAGTDIGQIMKDPEEHEHSDSAYDMLDEFLVGRLGTGEAVVSDDWEPSDDFEPEETDTSKDFEKNQFLDLRRPLLKQVWEANWSKSYYLLQVHQPRHLVDSAPLFGNFLDVRDATCFINVITYNYSRSSLKRPGMWCRLFGCPLPCTSTSVPPSNSPLVAMYCLRSMMIWAPLSASC
jgi:4-hydroxysphinganine ceramide fatty acyl 2-hydroxylase